jgi:hypothetical protein
MKNIKEIRTYKTFMELYNNFLKSTDNEHTDGLKSVIYMEVEQKGLIECKSILFILDEFELLN